MDTTGIMIGSSNNNNNVTGTVTARGGSGGAIYGAPPPPRLPFINHVLQHTLRSLCSSAAASAAAHEQQQLWVYSVFWRILPRHYPPPKWDNDAGPFDRNKGNRRNWILVWEDGYCDFVACSMNSNMNNNNNSNNAAAKSDPSAASPSSSSCRNGSHNQQNGGSTGSSSSNSPPPASSSTCLQPELFFKMSHDVYNYGEGLMGKVAADNSHKWIFRDPSEQEAAFLTPWQGSLDSYPRTWEAQFRAGIQTIAIIAVGEGLLQLGSTSKVAQDVDFVLRVQRKFSYLQSIPGVFAHHPSAATPPPPPPPPLPLPPFDNFPAATFSRFQPTHKIRPPPPPLIGSATGSFYGTDWLLLSGDEQLHPCSIDTGTSCRSWAASMLPEPNFRRHGGGGGADLSGLLGRRYLTEEAAAAYGSVCSSSSNNSGRIKEEEEEEEEEEEAELGAGGGRKSPGSMEEAAAAVQLNDRDMAVPPSRKRARVVPSMSSLQALLSKLPAVAVTGGIIPRPMTTLLNSFSAAPVPPGGGAGAGAGTAAVGGGPAEDQLIARLIS